MSDSLIIRPARPEDAPGLLAIYAPYVQDTAITFEYQVPGETEFRARMLHTLERFPYLAACRGEQLLGYAYASPFKERAAYAWAVETSIYVDQRFHSAGIGSALYDALEARLRQQHILNLNACITYPNPESIAFHERRGYQTVAHFHRCGYKLGAWWDVIWMERMLGEHPDPPLPVLPPQEL